VFNSRALFCITSAACYVVHLPCCYSYRLPFFLATALLNPGVDSLTLPIICWNNSLSAMPFSRSFSCCVALAWRANTDTQVFAATHPTEPNRTNPSRSISHSYYHHYYDYYSTLARCGIPLPFLTPPGVSLTLYLNPCNAVYGAHTGIAN
jgi:hypothetical protein